MAALKLGVLLTLAAVTVTQYVGVGLNPQAGGFYGMWKTGNQWLSNFI